jgi:membrane-bound lytic murein transglycosylase B
MFNRLASHLIMNSFRTLPLLIVLLSLLVAGCAHKPARSDKSKPPENEVSDTLARHESELKPGGSYSGTMITGDFAGHPEVMTFIDGMVAKHGFSRDYLVGLFSQAKRKQWTLDYLAKESGPAAATPRPGAWTRYRSKFMTEQHIGGGVTFWQRNAKVLQQTSQRYGVPIEYILGIMGVETQFGRNVGNHRVLDALSTLAFEYPRRAEYFREELEKFLVMTGREHIDPGRPVGSYAGAMGLGQFMPSSFLNWGVDLNKDGHCDLWAADDAIGSIANYFVQHGWKRDEPVVVPAMALNGNVQNLETGYDTHYSLENLKSRGIKPISNIRSDEPFRLLRLRANKGDEYWLGYQNFYVITRYNHSTHYAMAVHQLAQAIKQRYHESMTATR